MFLFLSSVAGNLQNNLVKCQSLLSKQKVTQKSGSSSDFPFLSPPSPLRWQPRSNQENRLGFPRLLRRRRLPSACFPRQKILFQCNYLLFRDHHRNDWTQVKSSTRKSDTDRRVVHWHGLFYTWDGEKELICRRWDSPEPLFCFPMQCLFPHFGAKVQK